MEWVGKIQLVGKMEWVGKIQLVGMMEWLGKISAGRQDGVGGQDFSW